VDCNAQHDDDDNDGGGDDDDDDDDVRRQTIPYETIMRGVCKIDHSVSEIRLEMQKIVEGHYSDWLRSGWS